jgi:hypothetical protein
MVVVAAGCAVIVVVGSTLSTAPSLITGGVQVPEMTTR